MKQITFSKCYLASVLALFLFLLFLSQGCKKKDDQGQESSSLTEQELLGTWQSDQMGKVLRFTKYHMFIDSNFYPTIRDSNLIYVLHAHYTVNGEYIYFDNFSLSYYYLAGSPSILRIIYYSNPRMKITSLFYSKSELAETRVLSPVDPANPLKLVGKWTTIMPVSAYDSLQKPHFVTGTEQREYDFSADSSWFTMNHILKFGNVVMPYSYGPIPYMMTEMGYYDLFGDPEYIFFKDNLMYMESPGIRYVKVKYE
jgi:hypothetical protein